MDEDSEGSVKLAYPKSPRIKDPTLLKVFRTFPCLACGVQPSDAHHLTTRGAGGDDVPQNLMPLCREHHAEYHARGPGHMIRSYSKIQGWLEHWNREDILRHASPRPSREPE